MKTKAKTVKAWGYKNIKTGKITSDAFPKKWHAESYTYTGYKVVRVEIKEVRK